MKLMTLIENDKFKIIGSASAFILAIISGAFSLDIASWTLYILALLVAGLDVYMGAVRGICRGDFLDEKFLMSIASFGALFLGETTEAVAVMLFFAVGEAFEHRAVASSRRRIRELMDICPDTARVLRYGEEFEIDADEIEKGDILIIKSGERVPADARIIEGACDVDTSALTGESLPRGVFCGETVFSGYIVIGGVIKCEALAPASESSAVRVLEMVEDAEQRKSKEESFITSFAKIYTPIVVSLAVLLATVPSLIGITAWSVSIYRALMFLVVSCPCALVISVPMAFFGGIGAMASKGILFKGGIFFSPLAKAENAVFDKTGTLTTGQFSVVDVISEQCAREELLALASAVEYASNHPIALSIRKRAEKSYTAKNIRELAGMGAIGTVCGKEIAVGNEALMKSLSVEIPGFALAGSQSRVFVSSDGEFLGAILISDEIKPEAERALRSLSSLGVLKTVMLTGDKSARAEEIASRLSIGEVKAELLPENKLKELEKIISSSGGKTIYVGDGINDAPSITLADVGVAMGAVGSDSAIECADVVIMSDNLEKIPEAVKGAKKTLRIARENIALALGIKIGILALSALGISNMWLAVFADVGVAIIAILNSMRTLASK